MNIFRFFQKPATIFLLLLLIILPLFFLPVTRDFYDTNKWMLFVCISLFVLFLWTARGFLTGNTTVAWSGPTLGFGLLTASSFLSLTISSFNKIEALLSPLGPITWIAATLILFFAPSLLSDRQKIILRLGLAIGGGIAGLLVLYQQLGLASLFFPSHTTLSYPFFTPLGSTMGFLTFCILVLPISISIALHALKEQKEIIAALSVVTSILTILGVCIILIKFGMLAYSQMLPLSTGLSLVRSSWNSIIHFLFGIGPEKFFEIFSLYRPSSLNLTPAWNIGFSANATVFFHVACTMGIIGVLCFIVFCIALWKEWSGHPITKIQAVLFILIALFTPPTLILIIALTLFLLSSDTQRPIKSELPGFGRAIIAPLLLLVILFSFFCLFRWYKGEHLLYQALQASDEGNGTKTFMLEEEALKTNPMNPGFHMVLSQTSILLAESVLKSAPQTDSNTPNLTDDDKTLLTNLTSRAVQEAKLAVTLDPANVNIWVNLARCYQGLIGIAKDSDTWAIAAYQKAFTLDPTNPVLHLDLGGLYMSTGKYEDAGKEFIAAIALKPNYIDAFYNLSNAFHQKGDWDNAVKALEQTKVLIAKGSTDEQKIDQEIISILEEKKSKGSSNQPTSLYVPQLNLPQ